MRKLAVVICGASLVALASSTESYRELLLEYERSAGEPPSAVRGKALYEQRLGDKSCTSCHSDDITKEGRARFFIFSKKVGPMALSVNPKRFRAPRETDRDFDKYCREVFGRICTAKEKGDLLAYFTQS